MLQRFDTRSDHHQARPAHQRPARRPQINVQDGLLFQWLKEATPLAFELVTGKRLVGLIARFDRWSVVVRPQSGGEMLIYKSAIACIFSSNEPTR